MQLLSDPQDNNLALDSALPAAAQAPLAGLNYSNFNSTAGLTLNGNASASSGALALTPAIRTQAGSAFATTSYQINGDTSFNTQFQFRLSGGDGANGADGFTFVLQNDSRGASAVGGTGGAVGYSNIARSLAIEFDTYDNGAIDPDGNHISLLRNGSGNALSNASTNIDLNSGNAVSAWIDYDGATNQLQVFLSSDGTKPGTALLTETIDLAAIVGSQAFVGFTAGTGGLSNIQAIQSWQFNATDTPPTGGGNGTGLRGEYFDNIDFTNSKVVRTDSTVNFDWANGSPDAQIAPDTFSVRWTGQVQPLYTEDYTFFTTSDDGVRLFVNGQQVINKFFNQAATTHNGTAIRLEAGKKYDIRMDYFENAGKAVAKLGWQSARQASQIIPTSQLFSNDSPGVFEVDTTPVSVREDGGVAQVRINRVGGSKGSATIDFITNDSTAKRDTDFTFQSRTLTFGDGVTTQLVDIPIVNDTVAEDTEQFVFAILGATGASLGTKRTTNVSILDDDNVNAQFAFKQVAYEAKENGGTATIAVSRLGSNSGVASVQYSTSDGTAQAGSDYTAATGTINFASGVDTQTFTVNLLNDGVVERDESVRLTLSNPTGGSLGARSQVLLNILNDDKGNFAQETVVSQLTTPTAIDWTPNGQYMFIAEQNGLVKVVNTTTNQTQATPFLDLRNEVNGTRDRGLLGMTLDPNFSNGRPYVYLLHTYDPPEAGDTTRPGYNPTFGAKDSNGNRPGRLIRVEAELVNGVYREKVGAPRVVLLGKNSTFANTRGFDANSTLVANANLPASGFVRDANGNNTDVSIQDYLAGDSESHSVGSVQFGSDGQLYVTIGDGTSYNYPDARTVRVQDLDNLSGKMLRINPDTGAGLADNPFATSDLNSNRSKVFNLGLRNPFRFTFDPKTNLPVIGDVGFGSWEEVNTGRGKNFGWPAYEGGLTPTGTPTSLRTGGYQELPGVQPFYPGGAKAITPQDPLFAFPHLTPGNAIVMGEYYTANTFPSLYKDALFISNTSKGRVSALFFDQTGKVEGTQLFEDNLFGAVQLTVGPDGSLYYVNLGQPINTGVQNSGSVGRWRPTASGAAPNAPAAPPSVQFVKGGFLNEAL
jgi:glucose/arabinose dehydrogenase